MTWELDFLLFLQNNMQWNWLKPLMIFVTKLGDAGIIWLVAIGFIYFYKKDKEQAITALFALVICVIVGNLIMKNIMMRPRPFTTYPYVELLISAPKDYSFPSGHTSASFATAAIISYFYPKKGKYAWLLASFIAFSRMFLFVHYPTDVLAGMLVGLSCAYFAIICQQNHWFAKLS